MSKETENSGIGDLVGNIEDYVELRRPRIQHIVFPDQKIGLRVGRQREEQEQEEQQAQTINLFIDLECPSRVVGEKLVLFAQEQLQGEFYFTRVDYAQRSFADKMLQLHYPTWGFGYEDGAHHILILEDTLLVHEWEIRALLKDFKEFFKACCTGEVMLQIHLESYREWKENVLSFIE